MKTLESCYILGRIPRVVFHFVFAGFCRGTFLTERFGELNQRSDFEIKFIWDVVEAISDPIGNLRHALEIFCYLRKCSVRSNQITFGQYLKIFAKKMEIFGNSWEIYEQSSLTVANHLK